MWNASNMLLSLEIGHRAFNKFICAAIKKYVCKISQESPFSEDATVLSAPLYYLLNIQWFDKNYITNETHHSTKFWLSLQNLDS